MISRIDTFRDVGTIGIWGQFFLDDKLYTRFDGDPLITIDALGEWYLGWKKKGGTLISDEDFKKKILSETLTKITYYHNMYEEIQKTIK